MSCGEACVAPFVFCPSFYSPVMFFKDRLQDREDEADKVPPRSSKVDPDWFKRRIGTSVWSFCFIFQTKNGSILTTWCLERLHLCGSDLVKPHFFPFFKLPMLFAMSQDEPRLRSFLEAYATFETHEQAKQLLQQLHLGEFNDDMETFSKHKPKPVRC